ncbi:MAG: hypothetical protein IJX18_03515 [Clostridia bacterium]|nr:hypothetical protein [Clostridia bacterium]
MPDYGTKTDNYVASVNIYSGLIGKIGKQLVEGETIESEFAGLYKENFKTGRDLEIAVYKAATGVDYSATDAPPAPFPQAEVLLFKQATKRTYPVKIDEKEIRESVGDEAKATDIAAAIVQTLYSGAFDEENANVVSMFADAVDTDAGSGVQIVNGGTYEEPATEAAAKSLLADMKNWAKLIRRGKAVANPKGLKVKASVVCALIPYNAETGVDVYARMGAENVDYSRYGIDEVYEYVPEEGETPAVYIFDTRYAQISKVHPDSYKERDVAGCDNVDAFLHRYVQYAACPLFNAVKLTEV